MLFVVPNACEFSPDNSRCTIVVESDCTGAKLRDAFTDLEGMEPIHMAQQYAASRGCPSFAVNGTPTHPYAVNVNGVSLEQVRGHVVSLAKNVLRTWRTWILVCILFE